MKYYNFKRSFDLLYNELHFSIDENHEKLYDIEMLFVINELDRLNILYDIERYSANMFIIALNNESLKEAYKNQRK